MEKLILEVAYMLVNLNEQNKALKDSNNKLAEEVRQLTPKPEVTTRQDS